MRIALEVEAALSPWVRVGVVAERIVVSLEVQGRSHRLAVATQPAVRRRADVEAGGADAGRTSCLPSGPSNSQNTAPKVGTVKYRLTVGAFQERRFRCNFEEMRVNIGDIWPVPRERPTLDFMILQDHVEG